MQDTFCSKPNEHQLRETYCSCNLKDMLETNSARVHSAHPRGSCNWNRRQFAGHKRVQSFFVRPKMWHKTILLFAGHMTGQFFTDFSFDHFFIVPLCIWQSAEDVGYFPTHGKFNWNFREQESVLDKSARCCRKLVWWCGNLDYCFLRATPGGFSLCRPTVCFDVKKGCIWLQTEFEQFLIGINETVQHKPCQESHLTYVSLQFWWFTVNVVPATMKKVHVERF